VALPGAAVHAKDPDTPGATRAPMPLQHPDQYRWPDYTYLVATRSTVPGVTEPDVTGPSSAAIRPRGAPPHAGQVVRRVLLRRNIVIDAETAQLVAAAVQAALQADAQSRPSARSRLHGCGE
jgi:hypothetical protein